jgi:hypothetical protein
LPKDSGDRRLETVPANVLDRQFVAERPNQKWIADVTYLWTAEGWLCVAAVIDLFSRRWWLVDECEKAPESDPSTAHWINNLTYRSALGPRAYSQAPSRAMAGSAAIFGVSAPPAIGHARFCGVSCEMVGRIYRPFQSECLLSLCGPERSRLFSLIAFELVCHPEQRAEDDGAIIAGQVHDTSLDNEAA